LGQRQLKLRNSLFACPTREIQALDLGTVSDQLSSQARNALLPVS
jgi:hypothetical protein